MAVPSGARSVETLIKALQKALAPLPSRSVLKRETLYLMVELPPEGLFSRSLVLHRIAGQLESSPVQGVNQVVVYGRLQGETQPQWKKVFHLASGESSADATQIVLPGAKISEIKVLEAQRPVVDPEGSPDFRQAKTLEAPIPTIPKGSGKTQSASDQGSQPSPIPVTAGQSPDTPRNFPVDLQLLSQSLGQQLHQPALRPFLAGALALSLVLGGGLVVHSFRQDYSRSRARALGLGIPLLVLAAGGSWLAWRGRRPDSAAGSGQEGSRDWFAEGLSFLRANQVPEAVECFQEAVRRQPDHAEAHVELAHLLVKTNRLQEALQHYQQARRLQPNFPGLDTHLVETLKALARQGLARSAPDEVVALLSDALPFTQGSAQAELLTLLGQAWAQKGAWAEALAQYQRAQGLDPHLSEAHLGIAQVYLKLGQWDEAIDSCWAALELDDALGLAHHVMGQALMRKGQLKAAIAAFRTALNLDLSPVWAIKVRVDLGLALIHAGQLTQASQEFSQAILSEQSPDTQLRRQQGRAYYGLGLVLAAQEQYTEAVKNYRQALELDPNLHEAVAAMGLAYLGRKERDAAGRKFVHPQQIQEALQQFERALKGDPDLPEAHFGIGETQRIKGDLSSAEASYRRAIRGNGSYGLAHYRLGSVLVRQGKLEQAVEHFRLALEIYPNFPEAKASLQRLLARQIEEVHTALVSP